MSQSSERERQSVWNTAAGGFTLASAGAGVHLFPVVKATFDWRVRTLTLLFGSPELAISATDYYSFQCAVYLHGAKQRTVGDMDLSGTVFKLTPGRSISYPSLKAVYDSEVLQEGEELFLEVTQVGTPAALRGQLQVSYTQGDI